MKSEVVARASAPVAAALPWRRDKRSRVAKRVLDLAIAVPGTVLALPMMGAVAAIVRATSPGPVLFRQQRIGLDGAVFEMWKFRTMRADNADGSARGTGEVSRGDPRLTPVGAMLRASRLDELPQLFHVISGRMSLVGPRPDVPQNLPLYAKANLVRFAMPPGCTTLAFTRGADAADILARQLISAEYVQHWSLWLDVRILARTAVMLVAEPRSLQTASG